MGKVLTIEEGEGTPSPQLLLRYPLSQRTGSYEQEHGRTQKRVFGLHYIMKLTYHWKNSNAWMSSVVSRKATADRKEVLVPTTDVFISHSLNITASEYYTHVHGELPDYYWTRTE